MNVIDLYCSLGGSGNRRLDLYGEKADLYEDLTPRVILGINTPNGLLEIAEDFSNNVYSITYSAPSTTRAFLDLKKLAFSDEMNTAEQLFSQFLEMVSVEREFEDHCAIYGNSGYETAKQLELYEPLTVFDGKEFKPILERLLEE